MKRPILAAVVALTAWWSAGENVAHAQIWRIGTYGMSSVRPRQVLNSPQSNQLTGDMQQGYTTQGAGSQQATLESIGQSQTGHPVTHFNYDKYFPLNYGTSSGSVLPVTGITGTGSNYGLGAAPGSMGGSGGYGYGLGIGVGGSQNFGTLQRIRTGTGR